MIGSVVRMLRAAEAAGVMTIMGGGGGGGGVDNSGGFRVPSSDFFLRLARVFSDVAKLAHQIDGGSDKLAPNRAVMYGEPWLFSMGLGECFTTCASKLHVSRDTGVEALAADDWRARIFADRVLATVTVTMFTDPDYNSTDGDNGSHSFELVYSDGARVQLRNGTVLVSKYCSARWSVEYVGNGGKKLIETHFITSSRAVNLVCDCEVTTSLISAPDCFLGALASKRRMSRRDAFEVFLSGR